MSKLLLSISLALNLLTSIAHAQTCEITQVTAVPLPCMGIMFSVSVDLEVTNPSSPGFTLAGNGVIYGTYLYTDLPVTVGPFLGDPESTYEFIAWDVENAQCQQFTTLPAANCGPICSISNFQLDFFECQGPVSAFVEFDFDYENPPSLTFDLLNEEGELISTHFYSSLPVTIPYFIVNGAAPIALTVCDHESNDCCETFTLDAIDCNPNNCEIFSLTVDPECTGANFLAHLNFGFDNPPSDSFKVMGNNLNYGTFGYNEIPITLGPLNGSSNIVWHFVVADSESGNCNDTTVLGIYHCPPPCNMLALEAMALECNGNEAYALEIGLEIEGEGDNGFEVFSQTTYYGNYSYEDLPLILPAYESTCEFLDYVSVCDAENLGCCATTPFETLLCCGCLIYNLTATPLPCNQEGEIMVEIDFDHQNVSGDGFEITGNSTNYGQFAYEDLPVQVGPFPGDGSQFFEFVVSDLGDPFCFAAVELGFINCDEICELSNLIVETGVCTGNNTFVASIDFDYQGVSGVGFDLFINGDFYENYSYDDLPLTIQEFPGSGNALDTITVCENDNPQCCATIIFEAPNCQCSIYDATVQTLDCTSDTTFAVALEFFSENTPGDFVDVFLDGVFIGFYNGADQPLIIDIPEGSGTALLTVCANDQNDCCDEVLFELIDCPDMVCDIRDLVADPGECTSDSTYSLHISFISEYLPGDSVVVTANGNYVGQYPASPLPLVIQNFPEYNSNFTTLTVCAVGAPDCCETIEFETLPCGPPPCHIYDLVAEAGVCTSDTTYNLHVNFFVENLPGDSVTVTGNGNSFGNFAVTPGNNMFIFGNFPVYNTPNTNITVCAVGAPDCCDGFEFDTPDCGPPVCQIAGLHVEAGQCTTDSTFILHVLFDFEDLPTDSVIITGNGNYIGQYQVHEGHIILEHFPIYDTTITVVTVCAVGNSECCDVVEFETPNCEGCHIFDLVADFGDCTSDTTYSLLVHYNSYDLPSDSVIVTSNGDFSGQFPHNPDGFIIPNFPIYGSNNTVITICAVGAPDCCDSFEFDTPDCGPDSCVINELFAEAGQCTSDSTFVVDVVFNADDLPTDSVDIYANDQYLGQYFNHPDFIHIENFPLLDGENTTVTVCAVGDSACCDTYIIENPPCGDSCSIFEVSVNVFDCSSDTTFGILVNFQYQNIPGGGFDVYAGDTYLGFYTFEQVPIEIGNFPANETGNYAITICESDGTTCCTSFEFEGPVCGPQACNISNVEYALSPCDSAGNFYFILDFEHTNTGAAGFNVVGNGNNYGNFSYENLPIEIGPFPTNSTVYEFLFTDGENPACFEIIVPGVVQCDSMVSVTPVDFDLYFEVFNNGTIPGFYAKKDIVLSLFNASGYSVLFRHPLTANDRYELNSLPAGLYIATVMHGDYIWPVKVVKAGY